MRPTLQFMWWLDGVLHRWRWTERLGSRLCDKLERDVWVGTTLEQLRRDVDET